MAKRGRPPAVWLTSEEVAGRWGVPAWLIRARCEVGGYFPRAVLSDGSWMIHEGDLVQALRCKVGRLFSVREAAGLLGVSYTALVRVTAQVLTVDAPLPRGKTLRALPLFLTPGAKPLLRVPEEELLRLTGRAAA